MPAVQTDLKSPVAGNSGRWAKLQLSPIHNQAWSETKATMLWAVPGYSDIWLAMMCDKDHEMAWFTTEIETAATDDKFLYANPKWYFGLTLDERLFVGCHEIAHAMYGHAGLFYMLNKQEFIQYADGVSLPVDHELLNYAADYVINDQLVAAKIGSMPEGGLHMPNKINGDMSVMDAYRLLWELKKQGRKTNNTTKPGDGKPYEGSGKSFDKLLKPGQGQGKTPNKAMSERSQTEWDIAVQAAMESAKLRGQLPANLERLFTKRLNPKADWRDLFAIAVSKKIGNDRYTWQHLDQQLAYRNIGCPGRSTYGCDLVVIVVDTSGSINQRTFDVFMAEATSLMEQAKPKRIVFAQCDTDIQEWSEFDGASDLYECKLKIGGGTSFRAPFERVRNEGLEPDLLVYLTDLYGDQNEIPRPNFPVVWGCITNENAPWGEIVRVPPQAE
jgi:predicted metal-dependent peptidase